MVMRVDSHDTRRGVKDEGWHVSRREWGEAVVNVMSVWLSFQG